MLELFLELSIFRKDEYSTVEYEEYHSKASIYEGDNVKCPLGSISAA